MPSKKSFFLVVNPSGGTGQGLEVLKKVQPIFADDILNVHITEYAGHAAEMVTSFDLSDCDGICLIGGDGTLHEVVNGLMNRAIPFNVPLGIIPGGTGNSVAQHFECSDPVDAAKRIVSGNVQPLDVIKVMRGDELDYCVNIIGWGALVDITRIAEKLRLLGPSRYALAAIIHILHANRREAEFIIDGRKMQGRFIFAAACNTRLTGKGMLLAPKADSSDGKIDLVLVKVATRRQMLQMFRKVYDGSHVDLPWVEHLQVNSLSIVSKSTDILNLDGELKGTTPVSLGIIPGALKVFV